MYEKDGEKYFVLDTHLHFWDASPANWVKGSEQYAKGWIECFHAYQSLGPPETHWSLEHFQKYSADDFEKDVFTDGYVDMAIFQSTYLREWYTNGFNALEQNAALLERFPGKFIVNGRWDPREGDAGLAQLESDHERYGLKGVKLYTAEWREGSRGWTLKDPEAERFLAKCQELGIKNMHVHKGPTIWPLDKDAFDVKDIDVAATSFPELNFVVEHVGLPRIEDFCFMATQEPNVYAGLSVVVGALMHARPRFFERCLKLGIKNIHVHKGPTIWPLDKDSFDVKDVDIAATSYPELNFIVEHVGLPRIEDFCFMATQEPNVYAGLSVVVGALMHARPRFFAKVMGELLFWVGEDKMLFGSDYAIWEPKWQIEGLVDWDYPDDTFSDYPRWTTAAKKKVLGLNAARLYDIEVPEELRLPADEGTPAAPDDAQLVEGAA